MFLKVLGILFVLVGAIISFGAKFIVQKLNLTEKVKIDFKQEMDEESIANYKLQRSIVNVKMWGMLVALPGIILVLIYF